VSCRRSLSCHLDERGISCGLVSDAIATLGAEWADKHLSDVEQARLRCAPGDGRERVARLLSKGLKRREVHREPRLTTTALGPLALFLRCPFRGRQSLDLDELDEALADELRQRLNALERAEERLAAGTYGLSRRSSGIAVPLSIVFLPGLTIEAAAAPRMTLIAVIVAVLAGALVLFPSLALLFRLVLSGRLAEGGESVDLRPTPTPRLVRASRQVSLHGQHSPASSLASGY
jgi:hypothetical protein